MVFLTACSSGTGSSQGGSSNAADSNITVAVSADFTTMDPQNTNDNLSYSVQKTIYQGLLGFDKNMKVIGVLADSWKVNDTATQITFKLRKGISFSDGTPFNAEAVKANLDRVTAPDSGLIRASLFNVIDNTKVIDDSTVEVNLKQPFGAIANTFAHPAGLMISPAAIEKYGKEVSRHPVGTGPYIFKEWVSGDHLTVTKNDKYWDKSNITQADSITFKPTPEDGTRIAMLQSGEADFIYPVPANQFKSLSAGGKYDVTAGDSIYEQYVSMNTNVKPFNDVKVRQAINYAIDKQAFINVVFFGQGEVADAPLAPSVQYYAKQGSYAFDLAKAKQLMTEAGYPNGFSTTIWSNNTSQSQQATEFVQQQLAKINIKVKVEQMESGTLSDRLWGAKTPADAEVQMYYGGWSPSTGDADWGLRPLLGGTDSFPPNSYNTAYYNDDVVNAQLKAGLASADDSVRAEAYDKAQAEIWKTAPWVFLTVPKNTYASQKSLQGVYLSPDGLLNVGDLSFGK